MILASAVVPSPAIIMIRHQFAAGLFALLLFGCASVPALPAEVARQPMDVRTVSVPESKGGSESGLTFATWALAVVTLAGFAFAARQQSRDMRESIAAAKQAAEAAQRSADLATQASQQAAKERREGLVRETSIAIQRVAFTGVSVRKLAEKVPRAMAELFTLSGRAYAIGAGDLPGSDIALERTTEAEAMAKNASSIFANDWRGQSDDQIANTLVLMESHLEKLHLVKDEILRDLSEIEAEKAAVRATRQVSPHSYPPPSG